jgi:hypothetical protein
VPGPRPPSLGATLILGFSILAAGCITQTAWKDLVRPRLGDVDRVVSCSGRQNGFRVELHLTTSDGERLETRRAAYEPDPDVPHAPAGSACTVRCVVIDTDAPDSRQVPVELPVADDTKDGACVRAVTLLVIDREIVPHTLAPADDRAPDGAIMLVPARSTDGLVAFSFLSPLTVIADVVTSPVQGVMVLYVITTRH